MLLALNTYTDQKYWIQNKTILYKVSDVLLDVSYGYNTVYAYLKEF